MQILCIKIRVRVADPDPILYKHAVLNPDPKSYNVWRVFSIYFMYMFSSPKNVVKLEAKCKVYKLDAGCPSHRVQFLY